MSGTCDFPTPTAGPWKLSTNGVEGTLTLTSDQNGNLSGMIDGDQAVLGFWDCLQLVTFLRIIEPSNPSAIQVFTGVLTSRVYLDTIQYTITGTYQAFSGPGVSAQQHVFPWSAHMMRIVSGGR